MGINVLRVKVIEPITSIYRWSETFCILFCVSGREILCNRYGNVFNDINDFTMQFHISGTESIIRTNALAITVR